MGSSECCNLGTNAYEGGPGEGPPRAGALLSLQRNQPPERGVREAVLARLDMTRHAVLECRVVGRCNNYVIPAEDLKQRPTRFLNRLMRTQQFRHLVTRVGIEHRGAFREQ